MIKNEKKFCQFKKMLYLCSVKLKERKLKMNAQTYKQMSQTAEGRKEAHKVLLNDIKNRMNKLVEEAPEANKSKCQHLMDVVFTIIIFYGISDLFHFFGDDTISDNNFLHACQDVLLRAKSN